MKRTKTHKAFTLIELLIVIVIIGILAAALIPRLVSVQGRARDTKRKADLRQIIGGLELYRIDKNAYPEPENAAYDYSFGNFVFSRHATTWISGLNIYMTSMPLDPINNRGDMGGSLTDAGPWRTNNFIYGYGAYNNGSTYDLDTQLENHSDPERCEIKKYKYYYPTSDRCVGANLGAYPSVIYLYENSPDSF